MATLKSKVILFDDSCPMCRLYTWLFVKAGILEKENRIGFANASPEILSQIDLDRGRHEIPLWDRETGKTEYGLRGLFLILGTHWPVLMPIFKNPWTYRILFPLYQIITFNRRVIAGCPACNGFDCAPDFHRYWRSIYLGLMIFLTLLVLAALQGMDRWSTPWSVVLVLWLVVMGLFGIFFRSGVQRWNFFGNGITILFMVSMTNGFLLLLPNEETTKMVVSGVSLGLLGWESHRRLG